MNYKTIADGIAARFGTVTATNGSATESATATADLPNQVAGLALLVYPPTGPLSLNIAHHNDDLDFPVRLLRDPINMPERTQWLYAWATALRPIMEQGFTLGIAGVTQALPTEMRIEPDGQNYASPLNTPGGDPFDVVELMVHVQIWELATGVAP
jgi:hypothetical protein